MPTINIQNIGSNAASVGKTVHHATLSAFATWLNTRDLVANDEIVYGHVYNSETITGNVNLYPKTFSGACYFIVEPGPGFGHADLAPSGALDYGTVGIELTRLMQGNAFYVQHGGVMRGFRLKFTANGGSVGITIGRQSTAAPNNVFNARLQRCLILCQGNASNAYAVSTNVASTACDITDNVFFYEGTAGYALLAREGNYDRNTFTARGAGVGLSAVFVGATSATSKARDNVFYQHGPKPILRDTASLGLCDNNYTSEAIVGVATGFTVGSTAMIVSANDARPAAGGILIGKGSLASANTTDIRGGFRGAVPDVGTIMRQAMPLPVAPNATVTGAAIFGQRVTVSFTYTSNVETAVATLTPAATPNGAAKSSGAVTMNNGTGAAVFNNVNPGNYLAPSIILTNQGGTGTSGGGAPTIVPMPAVPSVKIVSQTKSGQNLTISGVFTGIPTSASVTLPAASPSNGAVTKGPQAISLNDDGSFVAVLGAITPGSYERPVISATNYAGTGSATGSRVPRIYANGTQPEGAEPAIVLDPYIAPTFESPAIALGEAITSIQLQNTSTSAGSNLPFTLGHAFKQGDIAPSSFIIGKTAGLPDVPLQFNVKATHPDGSVRHAIISGVLPSLAGSATRTLSLVRAASSTTATSGAAASSVTTAGLSVVAKITIGGVVYTASPDALLAANTPQQVWMAGAIATDWIVAVPFKDASNVPHASMTAQFSVRYYPGAGNAKIDVAFEDVHPYNSATLITYDAAITVNGATRYSKTALAGVPASRFKKTVWWTTEPTLHIRHDPAYLVASRMVPPYDLSVQIDNATLDQWVAQMQTAAFDPYRPGVLRQGMSDTGGRNDIGPLPHFAAATVISMDKRAKDMLLIHADNAAGSWSTHLRDHTNGPGAGRPLSIIYFPYATKIGTTADAKNPSTGKYEKFAAPLYGQDTSHQPSIAYLPYLLTGDFYYLEELLFWANYNEYSANPGYRQYEAGLFYFDQIRGIGWCLRTLAQAAGITPDDHPDKANFGYWINNNLRYFNNKYTDNPNANPFGVSEEQYSVIYPASGANIKIGIATWQEDYLLIGVAHCSDMGFTEATRLMKWQSKFQIGRMLAPGFCWIHGAAFYLQIRDTQSSPMYTSWSQLFDPTIDPQIRALPCNSPERVAKMNELMPRNTVPWVRGEMTGYADGTAGYPSILQASMSYLASYDIEDVDLAWDLLDSRTVKPNYGSAPQFAMRPRAITESTGPTDPTDPAPAVLPADNYTALVGQVILFGTN